MQKMPKILCYFACCLLLPGADVLMQHNNPQRTGANLEEKQLTTSSVNTAHFGRLWNLYADGQVVAQPLYVEWLPIDTTPNPETPLVKGIFNAVVVATMHNTIYVYDADRPRQGPDGRTIPLWAKWLQAPRPGNKEIDMWSTNDPEWGILSTPVISPDRSTLYVVTWNSNDADGFFYQLHALDLHSGAARSKPMRIGPNSKDPSQPCRLQSLFNPCIQKQRAALLLHQGHVFIAFGGDGNRGSLFAMDAVTLRQKGFWTSTPQGADGGIWQSGQGPAADAAGNIFLSTGNGTFGGANFGNSIVKLRFDGRDFRVLDSFTPCNVQWLNQPQIDLDLGSSGPLLVNGTLIGGGKEGVLYALPRNNLGGHRPSAAMQNCANAPQVQSFLAFAPATHGGTTHHGNIHGSPVYWKGPDAERIYVWGENGHLQAYRFGQGKILNPANPRLSGYRPPDGMPGGMLAVSASGSQAGTGIVWAVVPLDGDANQQRGVQGILLALDAQDVSRTLWTSEQFAQRDRLGLFARFANPIIAGGKVFVSTFGNQEERRTYRADRPAQFPGAYYVAVYGALAETPPTIVNQGGDDITVVQATTTPLEIDLAQCTPLDGGSADCTTALGAREGAASFHPILLPADVNQLSCSLLTVTTATRTASLAASTGIGFFTNRFHGGNRTAENSGLFITKAQLPPGTAARFLNGDDATLHHFVGVVNCPEALGRSFKPFVQFESKGRTVRRWDRSADYSISPAQPALDRRHDVLLP